MEKLCVKGHLKRKGKRMLAILLCACMIGTMIPVTARAESGSTETGLCEHHTEHAIVIDTEPMDVASNDTAGTNADVSGTASESQDTETEATQTGVEGKSDAWNPWWIIVIGIMVIVIGAGVFFVVKKREENEKE